MAQFMVGFNVRVVDENAADGVTVSKHNVELPVEADSVEGAVALAKGALGKLLAVKEPKAK